MRCGPEVHPAGGGGGESARGGDLSGRRGISSRVAWPAGGVLGRGGGLAWRWAWMGLGPGPGPWGAGAGSRGVRWPGLRGLWSQLGWGPGRWEGARGAGHRGRSRGGPGGVGSLAAGRGRAGEGEVAPPRPTRRVRAPQEPQPELPCAAGWPESAAPGRPDAGACPGACGS